MEIKQSINETKNNQLQKWKGPGLKLFLVNSMNHLGKKLYEFFVISFKGQKQMGYFLIHSVRTELSNTKDRQRLYKKTTDFQ